MKEGWKKMTEGFNQKTGITKFKQKTKEVCLPSSAFGSASSEQKDGSRGASKGHDAALLEVCLNLAAS